MRLHFYERDLPLNLVDFATQPGRPSTTFISLHDLQEGRQRIIAGGWSADYFLSASILQSLLWKSFISFCISKIKAFIALMSVLDSVLTHKNNGMIIVAFAMNNPKTVIKDSLVIFNSIK